MVITIRILFKCHLYSFDAILNTEYFRLLSIVLPEHLGLCYRKSICRLSCRL